MYLILAGLFHVPDEVKNCIETGPEFSDKDAQDGLAPSVVRYLPVLPDCAGRYCVLVPEIVPLITRLATVSVPCAEIVPEFK
jgi:hypothetical protein